MELGRPKMMDPKLNPVYAPIMLLTLAFAPPPPPSGGSRWKI